MEPWVTYVLAFGGTALVTCIINFIFQKSVIKASERKEREKEEQIRRQKEEHDRLEQLEREQEHVQRINEIKTEIEKVVKPLVAKVEEIDNKLEKVGESSKSNLRYNILTSFYRCSGRGYKTQDEAENFNAMCDAYHGLKGNSFVDRDIIPGFREIPLLGTINQAAANAKPEDDKKDNEKSK